MQFVVLLRGVNAGPRNRIKMDKLRPALTNEGFDDVRTLVQSGNIILASDHTARQVKAGVQAVLTTRFELDVEVVLRDESAWRAVVADNPFQDIANDGRHQIVVFCSEPHDPRRLPTPVAPERLVSRPMELHLWCPDGASEGKLLPALGRHPPAPITSFRNWNTVTKLATMLDAGP